MKQQLPSAPKITIIPLPSRKKYYSPNISRAIPEAMAAWQSWEYAKIFLVTFLCGFLLMAIVVQGFEIKTNQENLNKAKAQRESMLREEIYWRTVTARYSVYRDGYLKLASIAYRLGKKERAKHYFNQALEIDPNYPLKDTIQAILVN